MQAKMSLQLLAFFAIGTIAAPTGFINTGSVGTGAVQPVGYTTSKTLSLETRDNNIEIAGLTPADEKAAYPVEQRAVLRRSPVDWMCTIPGCRRLFSSEAARDRHMKTAVHIAPDADNQGGN
ncbi:uncharacterized protein PpBr36_09954 [Pyricularia pennisetigena]|uniref:uncharacterized protein n=1 Tax=Pyricularia pennisetigena TaxID=1578925 RepID=UPI00114E178D|nr:uncharacterized protein PpBr36_09954 [Pyricularia pennisetigena]TLS22282.1 hypothetical protein PpBr36_09954 [Pyricularia pennisetigena]